MPPVSTGFPPVSSECLFLVHILVHIGGFWPIFGPCLTSSSPDSEGAGEWRRGSELNGSSPTASLNTLIYRATLPLILRGCKHFFTLSVNYLT